MVFPSMDYENMSECLIIITFVQIMGIGILCIQCFMGLPSFAIHGFSPHCMKGFGGAMLGCKHPSTWAKTIGSHV